MCLEGDIRKLSYLTFGSRLRTWKSILSAYKTTVKLQFELRNNTLHFSCHLGEARRGGGLRTSMVKWGGILGWAQIQFTSSPALAWVRFFARMQQS